jgi:hypothetical protein
MNRRQEERLADLNTAYQNEVRNIMEDDVIREAEPMEAVMESPGPEIRRPVAIEPEDESPYKHISPYNLTIEHVSNGFIIRVGCQTFVFEKFETACKYMTMYYNDVEGTRKKHVNGTLFV